MMSNFSLAGKVIVITGGTGFLGKKHAEAVAEMGGTPILLDLNINDIDDFISKLNTEYEVNAAVYRVNITAEEYLTKVLSAIITEYKGIDGLINNASLNPKMESKTNSNFTRFEDYSLDSWNKEIQVGLTGAMLCTKIIGNYMSENGGGVIVNVSSDLGLIAPDQRIYKEEGLADDCQPVKPVTYSVIKHALIGLTKYTATYWADKGVRCNAIAPGGVYNDQPDVFVNKLKQLIPLGRMANEDEYKGSIQFLLSRASSYMTGSVLAVDGGRSCW